MTESDAPRRVFFALWPEGVTLDALDAAAHLGVARCGGRRMRRDSLHMTLLFIGAAGPAELERLCGVADGVRLAPFAMTLDRFGYWPHNRILWAGSHAAPSCQRRLFTTLADGLAAAGFRLESRPCEPHVTLARHARCAGLPELAQPIDWRVEEFALIESFLQPSGARYRSLKRWPLREST